MKLGKVWVDPAAVVFMEPEEDKITIVTERGGTHTMGDIDNFAAIINAALAPQSFGGAVDEEAIAET